MTSLRFREATDVASVCKEIVLKTAIQIGDRRYVKVEGWTSIAVAHGCIASVKPGSVREFLRDGKVVGFEAIGQVRRQTDGVVLSEAEGYVGDDEETWFGSHGVLVKRWSKTKGREVEYIIPKRADYAIRSMAQTRAVSKVCRNAFSHVVVLMDAGLSTTPYEEMADPNDEQVDIESRGEGVKQPPAGGTQKAPESKGTEKNVTGSGTKAPAGKVEVPRDGDVALKKQFEEGRWKNVHIHFGKNGPQGRDPGVKLGDLERDSLKWYCFTWERNFKGRVSEDDKILAAACDVAIDELGLSED